MRKCLALLLISATFMVMAQNSLEVNTGANRMGFGHEINYVQGIGKHEVVVGGRVYVPGFLFSKIVPGLNLRYAFHLLNREKWSLYSGVSSQFFREEKENVLNVWDAKLVVGVSSDRTQKWQFFGHTAFGQTRSNTKNQITGKREKWIFYNPELLVGLRYCWACSSK